jgi:hypothetical protein
MVPPLGRVVSPVPAACRAALALGLLWALAGAPTPARAQADSLRAAPPDTTTAPPDTAAAGLGTPLSFRSLAVGRPVVDSLPALLPPVGLEHVLARQPGSFLYDLGAVGWPHGWSPEGLGPHRSRLWIEGRPYNSPLTGRARFDLLPTSLLSAPRVGVAPGGTATGVHLQWRAYDQIRPLTELRFRRDSNGQKAIEVGHSQKHRLTLFGTPGLLQASIGYGGRAAEGVYAGSDLRRERRLWGRLRYQRDTWALELSDFSSRHRVGAQSGVVPPEGAPFEALYLVPFCQACSRDRGARRRTYRNDLTARLRAPLVPGLRAPTTLSLTWTDNTFDYEPDEPRDTTFSVVMNGGHAVVRQPLRLGGHALTLGAQGSVWAVERSNVPPVDGRRWSAHAFARDSVRLGGHRLVLNAGWHATPDQQYPSAAARWRRAVGAVGLSASVTATGQRRSWFDTAGFPGFVRPLPDGATASVGRVLRGRVGLAVRPGPFDLQASLFAHQIRDAVDLYAPAPAPGQRLASTDSVVARRTDAPVRRAGATLVAGWRRDADRGLYATATGTALSTLNADASPLHTRLARTLPAVHGRGRLGARFVFFEDLTTDLYVQARGWTAMNSRWFHPPTGRLVVPPARTPLPARGPGVQAGPSGTVDVHAEIKLRGATLFFTFENVQSSLAPAGSFQQQATLTPGTFVVPVYPLPGRLFRFGVHWPIFD